MWYRILDTHLKNHIFKDDNGEIVEKIISNSDSYFDLCFKGMKVEVHENIFYLLKQGDLITVKNPKYDFEYTIEITGETKEDRVKVASNSYILLEYIIKIYTKDLNDNYILRWKKE